MNYAPFLEEPQQLPKHIVAAISLPPPPRPASSRSLKYRLVVIVLSSFRRKSAAESPLNSFSFGRMKSYKMGMRISICHIPLKNLPIFLCSPVGICQFLFYNLESGAGEGYYCCSEMNWYGLRFPSYTLLL